MKLWNFLDGGGRAEYQCDRCKKFFPTLWYLNGLYLCEDCKEAFMKWFKGEQQ